MNEFATIRSSISKDSHIAFSRKVAEAEKNGWEIINSGCDGGCFWVILRGEAAK